MTTEQPWKIRAAQLDLARQKETVQTVCDFIGFAADAGYNTLLLYLEAIVRTESFHELPESMSYSPQEIRQIVARAGEARMEVVPCISTLGHAEHFFLVDRMKPLAEAVEGQRLMTFCTSNPDAQAFLERYLSEVAALFPSPHFHVGMDETWQIGRCPRCRARAKQEGSFLNLFVDHLLRMHGVLWRLGKRMWMWNDMLEFAPRQLLERVPRDVMMCVWNYGSQSVHRRAGVQGHFDQLKRHNTFALFQEVGFDVLVSPGAGGVRNVYEMTQYGRRYRNAGGLMTIWELGRRFLPGTLPAFMFGGLLWSKPGLSEQAAVEQMIDRLFPPDLDALERRAIAASSIESVTGAVDPQALLRGPMSLYEHHMLAAVTMHELLFQRMLTRADLSVLHRRILEEMWIKAAQQRIARQFRVAQQELIDPASIEKPAAADAIRSLAAELRRLADVRTRQWQEQRPGLEPEKAGTSLRQLAGTYEAFAEKWSQPSASDLLLEVDLFLWDDYSAPRLRIELLGNGSSAVVADGSFKPLDLRQTQYAIQVPIRLDSGAAPPEAVRFTVSAYGGQGIRFVRVLTAEGYYEPAAVLATSGEVTNPEAALIDHSTVCYLGSTDTVKTLLSQTDHLESSLTLSLGALRTTPARQTGGVTC